MKQGLKKTKYDPRDYHYKKTFGDISMVLPNEYYVGKTKILTQRGMFCTAMATNVAKACQEGKDFSPEWFFAQEKAISGAPLDEGEDLRTPMKTAAKVGFLPLEKAQFSFDNKDTTFLANPKNWPPEDLREAEPYKIERFFRVDGDFDSVRQVLWQNKDSKRAIVTGVQWYNEWTMSQGGFIPTVYNSAAGLHCICIIGFFTSDIDGQEYIVVQDSDGESVGDKGLFYFNKTVFNREFAEPMYMMVDLDDTVKPKPIGNILFILLFKLLRLLK